MPLSTLTGAPAAFNVQGIGLSTYSMGGYADSGVLNLAKEAALNGANYVEFSNIVLADLATGSLSDVIENGADQTAPLTDIGRAIDAAQALGLSVMLKPQVAVRDPAFDQYNSASWINMVNPDLSIANPAAFFANYKAHLLEWATLAEDHHVALLSIGNEMVAATKPQYASYWDDIISAVRQVYHGQLTYAALAPLVTNSPTNEIAQIGFWSKLDVAGFDVYPSLAHSTAPTVDQLTAGWRDATVFGHQQDYVAFLGQMAALVAKPVIFTETGLPSFDGASDRQATSDGDIGAGTHATDQQEQADWWQAFFRTWAQNPPAWLKGVIVNNNDPADLGAYYDQNYNINGKLAEAVVTSWFGGATAIAPTAHTLVGGQGDDQLYLFGPGAAGASSQAASLATTVSLKVTGAILSGAAPVLHAYVNGLDAGRIALGPIDSGVLGDAGVHFSADQTFTFEIPGLTRIDQLKLVMESPASVAGLPSTVVFHEVSVDGVHLTNASYLPVGAAVAVAQSLATGASQYAGGAMTFDAGPWNAMLASRTVGTAADPIVVHGGGGADVVHVLGGSTQYALTLSADGTVRLSESAGLNQNAVLDGVSAVAFGDGARLSLTNLLPGLTYRTGGAGNDVLNGGDTPNFLQGGDGADVITGGSAFDRENGNAGNDTLHGGAGDDWVTGGKDGDLLYGDDGNDIVNGNLGNDTVIGGAGADTLRGGQGDDVLTGGDGADYVSGDLGDDTMTGGAGADTFRAFVGGGHDVIADFNPGEGDRIQLDPGTGYSAVQQGADVLVTLTGGGDLVLKGVQLTSLTPGWII